MAGSEMVNIARQAIFSTTVSLAYLPPPDGEVTVHYVPRGGGRCAAFVFPGAWPPIWRATRDFPTLLTVYLQMVGADTNAAATADGLFEILSSALSGFEQPGRKIMAVPASEIRRRGIATTEEARRVYGANLAIAGNLERVGKSLRVTLNLVDTVYARQVDSRTFTYDPASAVASRKWRRRRDGTATQPGFHGGRPARDSGR